MKKRIWLALLPITLLWCGCSEDDHDHTREITAVASTYDVTVSQSTRMPITDTSFGGKAARVLAKETANDYATLWCNGTMNFDGTEAVKYSTPTDGGSTDFPDNNEVYLCGLYPADGWKCTDDTDISAGTAIASGVVKYTLDGKTDIMWAASVQATPDKAAALNFNHLLTRLNIKLKKDRTYDVIVKDIKLIKTAGDKLYTVCSVDLNESSVEAAVSFSSGDGSTKELPCFPTGSDGSFPTDGIDVPSINETDAYILAPSLTANDVGTNENDYTLRVDYSIGETKQPLTEVIKLNLENNIGTGGGDYTDATMGRTFEIELCFTLNKVRATATIEPWDDKYDPKVTANLPAYNPPLIEQVGTTTVEDGMTNCYMVVPGTEVVFPVSRAYVYDGTNFTDELRIGGTHVGEFEAKVLWSDDNVIDGTPIVIHKGNNAKVVVKTNLGVMGNAVVAITKRDETDILWSYHIWVTKYSSGSAPTWTNPKNNYAFMHYDLGATEDASRKRGIGLVYQWGRKDPFPSGLEGEAGYSALITSKFFGMQDADNKKYVLANKANNAEALAAGIKQSIRNPTTFYSKISATVLNWLPQMDVKIWNEAGDSKTIYDPCPYGYRVPVYVKTGKIKADEWAWAMDSYIGTRSWMGIDGGHTLIFAHKASVMNSFLWGYRDENGKPIHYIYTAVPSPEIYYSRYWMSGEDPVPASGGSYKKHSILNWLQIWGYSPDGKQESTWEDASNTPKKNPVNEEGSYGMSIRCCREI